MKPNPIPYNLNHNPIPQARWYNITSNAATRHAEIYLYGVIGGYYANVQQFLADLQNAGAVDKITVYLNTVGGSFYDGLPIYNTLKQHKAHVTVKVMGYALSMGSVIMLAANVVEAAENSLIMMHRAQGGVWGDADDMTHAAQILQKHEQAVLPEYMRRMGKSEQEVKALLQAETWFNAADAKAAGLVDVITGQIDPDLSTAKLHAGSLEYAAQHYRNMPETLLNRINANQTEGDETMTQDDIKAIAAAVTQAMNEDGNTVSKRKYEQLEADYAALITQLEKATAKADANAAAAAKLAELMKDVPGTVPPPVTAPAGYQRPFYG